MRTADRRKGIEAAIAGLKPLAGADVAFAIRGVEQMLDLGQNAIEVRPPLPSEGAEQLRTLAAALRATKRAAANLNKLAFEELNAAKTRRGLKWCSPSASTWSFLRGNELSDYIDRGYPSLIEAAEDAAKHLDQMKKSGRLEGRNQFLSALAATLAAYYEMLTGKIAPSRPNDSKFSRFVGAIFAAGDIYEPERNARARQSSSADKRASPRHWASLGATLHQESKGANPPEISWVSRLE